MGVMKISIKLEDLPDEELLDYCAKNDRRAFAVLVDRYQTLVCSVAYGIVGNIPSSEDLAQDAPPDLKQGWMTRYNYAAYRLVQLAEAIPEDKFAWSPGEGVMSVERVFMHIIRYNYLYPATSLGMAAPEVRPVPAGAFAGWMKAHGKLGGQHKVPRVITDSAVFADLRAFMERPPV